ncbi:galactokinase [Clostridia bacterium]|nr:galactokinase [Clostridia bacterium]
MRALYKPKHLPLSEISTAENLSAGKKRIENAVLSYKKFFGPGYENNIRIFSVPGRVEIGGNHTDHNCGKVMAASISLDIIAVVEPIDVPKIAVISEGYGREFGVWIDNLDKIPEEVGTQEGFIRGVVKYFADKGLRYGGFKAYFSSNIPTGANLGGSAAFGVMIGTILSYLYCGGRTKPLKIANAARYAESAYFGKHNLDEKTSGSLMDPIACAFGAFVLMDFKEPTAPVVESIDANFDSWGYYLCMIDTELGFDWKTLRCEHEAIEKEMKQIASFFDVECLRQVVKQDVILNVTELREKYGDRAILRALHYFNENDNVAKMALALQAKDFSRFMSLVNISGDSSFKYLQNIYAASEIKHQSLALGLNLAENSLAGKGACRIHGAGFSGTFQAYVPKEFIKLFRYDIERTFGPRSCNVLTIRKHGSCEIVL